MSKRIRERTLALPLRERIPYNDKTLPVLGILGLNDEAVFYAVQTENGIRTIEECSIEEYPDIYAGLGRKVDLPVYGHDNQFLMMEYVMALPESVLASETELDALGVRDYGLATQIAQWAESQFADTDVHDRDDVLLELTSGRVVHLFPYRR
jgi:hypothetical protein